MQDLLYHYMEYWYDPIRDSGQICRHRHRSRILQRQVISQKKESVYRALLAFTVIGCFISVTKISLCVWRIYLKYKGNESYEKCYDVLSLGAHSVKVILEAFPQPIIAKFYFVHCPIKKYGWGVRFLDPAFDTFCGFPFISSSFICVIMAATHVNTVTREMSMVEGNG